MRTSNSARRGMSAVRSFWGDVTRVVVYAIDDGSVASYANLSVESSIQIINLL